MTLAACVLALLVGPALGYHVAAGDDLGVLAAAGWYAGRGKIRGGEG